jgi:hypothetical protein
VSNHTEITNLILISYNSQDILCGLEFWHLTNDKKSIQDY